MTVSAATSTDLIERAIVARTIDEAVLLQGEIQRAVGARYQRPLGDRWNNIGHLTRPGNTDFKLLELVTNAQDALLELEALRRYGNADAVPYATPHEAARNLFGEADWRKLASLIQVQFDAAGAPPREMRRLTVRVRDFGCGMTPEYLPQSLFYLGTRHKGKAAWQQGAFGLGGAITFRHAQAVVVVTRQHPDLIPSEAEDRVAVAVCLWEEFEKGSGLYYLTTTDWRDGKNLGAAPWSVPAAACPNFEPGTQITLIGYESDRIHSAAWGGEWSFDKLLNTRLFDPVLPVRVENLAAETGHPQNYRGLKRQFEDNPRRDRVELTETVPFTLGGRTYHLPMSAYYFAAGPRADVGGKRNFVNPSHALMFISNGQCHEHWEPRELRYQTELKHIHDRVLVVISLDDLPIRVRTHLFPPDREAFIDSDDSRRLKANVVDVLNDWDELIEFDRDVLKQVISGDRNGRPTINVARQIGRALKFRGGFTLLGRSSDNGAARRMRKRLAKAVLYPEPTTIEGPASVTIERGSTRALRFHVNARDEFFGSRRGSLKVVCDHAAIGSREVTIGALHQGFVRVMIAVPEDAALGDYELSASVDEWERATGGVGGSLSWRTRLVVVDPVPPEERRRRSQRQSQPRAAGEGELVGVMWKNNDDFEEWHPGVPGHVDDVDADVLAEQHEDYSELAGLTGVKVPTIFLNRDYAPLKKYEAARARELTERGIDDARDRYAVGTGLALLLLERDLRTKAVEDAIPAAVELAAKQAAAQATLVMMPQYDRLAKEAGIIE